MDTQTIWTEQYPWDTETGGAGYYGPLHTACVQGEDTWHSTGLIITRVLNRIKRSDSKHVCDCTSDSSHTDANCYIWWILKTQKKLESGAKVQRTGNPIYQSNPDLCYTVLSEPMFTRAAWLINLLFALTWIWEYLTKKKKREALRAPSLLCQKSLMISM